MKEYMNKLTFDMCSQIRTSKTLDVDKFQEILSLSIPEGASGAKLFKYEYLNAELMSKFPRKGFTDDFKKRAAIEKMLESEAVCAKINAHGFSAVQPDLISTDNLINVAALVAQNILGTVDYGMFEQSRFSGGSSTSRKRRNGHSYFKYHPSWRTDCTLSALPYAESLIKATPLWQELLIGNRLSADLRSCFRLRVGNDITTVPKKTEIDRCIAKEPDMNMCLQKACGSNIRSKLKKFGIDLRDQSINQHWAMIGSLLRSHGTIDLAAASDSISIRMVKAILPPDWYYLLDQLRSHHGKLPDGTVMKWEKFSSMGNGFTFELESLLFFCIARAVQMIKGVKGKIVVYGDDIIAPSAMCSSLINALECVGFKTNITKTFTHGRFRESCGKHYYNGIDVSPFYIRKEVDSADRFIWLLNKLREWSFDDKLQEQDETIWPLYRKIYKAATSAFPILKRVVGEVDIGSSDGIYTAHAFEDYQRLGHKTLNSPLRGVRGLLTVMQDWSTGNQTDLYHSSFQTLEFTASGEPRLTTPSEGKLVLNTRDPWLFSRWRPYLWSVERK